MEIIYYCPKCKSEEVETICLNPPIPKFISMDDIGHSEQVQQNNLVYNQYKYQARCKRCGYTIIFNM